MIFLHCFFAKKHKSCVSTGNRQEVRGSQVFLTPLISRPKPENAASAPTRTPGVHAHTQEIQQLLRFVSSLPPHHQAALITTASESQTLIPHFQHTPSGPALVPPPQQMVCMSYLLQDGSQVAGGLQRGFSFPL